MTEHFLSSILIATDGSEKNRAALEEGIKVARLCGATLYAVYVIDTGTFSTMSGDIPLGDTYRVFQAEAEQAFARMRSLAGDLKVETAILEGRPAPEVVKFATRKKIDLIVIGTQGKRGLERLLLGSVAEEIIRSAPCKVLVVK
ncbi:UspA domain protein [Methanoregula boonei 6A8]|jgi:nucleotide-binding universal stress UspA family protein|uniref:UspA domain protein n=1 Tax=Methanoregula boonei (strain DSM 21154 / JCM 14090 / 6A8) TaxID=456442 RepID=A7IAE9_METB6|nr:universal stress protein [Methanoregula boonei]ABS56710.1 UspA domain protein [Methanoregula boonei 6A8]